MNRAYIIGIAFLALLLRMALLLRKIVRDAKNPAAQISPTSP